jgi:hypothetical protein
MELSDAPEKIPTDRGSIPGPSVAQCINHYATLGPISECCREKYKLFIDRIIRNTQYIHLRRGGGGVGLSRFGRLLAIGGILDCYW